MRLISFHWICTSGCKYYNVWQPAEMAIALLAYFICWNLHHVSGNDSDFFVSEFDFKSTKDIHNWRWASWPIWRQEIRTRCWRYCYTFTRMWFHTIHTCLAGGFKYFLFSSYLGKRSNLTNIFQMGWNHPPVIMIMYVVPVDVFTIPTHYAFHPSLRRGVFSTTFDPSVMEFLRCATLPQCQVFPTKKWGIIKRLPSRELTYPPKNGILKMIFLFPRWDMLIPLEGIYYCNHHDSPPLK